VGTGTGMIVNIMESLISACKDLIKSLLSHCFLPV